jgi:hypothetical protein
MSLNREICVICGLPKVYPQFEIDVEVGVISNWGELICEDCYSSEYIKIHNEIKLHLNKSKTPFNL